MSNAKPSLDSALIEVRFDDGKVTIGAEEFFVAVEDPDKSFLLNQDRWDLLVALEHAQGQVERDA